MKNKHLLPLGFLNATLPSSCCFRFCRETQQQVRSAAQSLSGAEMRRSRKMTDEQKFVAPEVEAVVKPRDTKSQARNKTEGIEEEEEKEEQKSACCDETRGEREREKKTS